MEEQYFLAELAHDSGFYSKRIDTARELYERSTVGNTYAAILGLKAENDNIVLATMDGSDEGTPRIYLQKVTQPPMVAELARAVADPDVYLAMARYAPYMTHELVLTDGVSEDPNRRIMMAYIVVAALRVRSRAEILVPAVSDHSWSTIGAIPQGKCQVRLIEDLPMAVWLGRDVVVTEEDFDWVGASLEPLLKLASDDAFILALSCFTSHPHQSNLRMATANLWSGIEAVFNVTPETTYRLSTQIAAFLEERGQQRFDRYQRVKKQYGLRSRIVHGRTADIDSMREHVREVGEMLAVILVKIIEDGKVPTGADLEELIFT